MTSSAQPVRALAEHRPDQMVSLEDAPAWRWVWFILGLITAMIGAGTVGFAIYDGVRLDQIAPALDHNQDIQTIW